MSNPTPKRLAKTERSKAPLVILIVLLAILALVIGGYFGLCSWVKGNGLLLPGTVVSGLPGGKTVDLSKMDANSAVVLIDSYLDADLAQRSLTVYYDGKSARLEGEVLATDAALPVNSALSWKEEQPLPLLGLMWLGLGPESGTEQKVSPYTISEEGHVLVGELVSQIAVEVMKPDVPYSYQVTEDTIELTLGMDGRKINGTYLEVCIIEALLNGETQVTAEIETIPSIKITGEALAELVKVPAQVSTIGEDGKLTPTTIGRGIDAAAAQAIIDQTEAGQSCSIPVVELLPDLTGAESILFQDVLASSDSYMAGPAGRRTNIRLAAAAIDGTVVFPGQTFSYNAIVGERTAEKGYQEATVYVQGKDRQELGGGICQLASALYYCSLYSNLEIVERKPHRFAVTYVPHGLDATIAWGSIDYKFTNNTDYPIRISTVTEGNDLHVKFYGTKADDTYVKMENIQLSKTPYNTLYQIDREAPVGQTTELVHAYTGYKYEVYRCVYAGDGTRISRTFENTSNYSYRDKVIGINAADAAKYGIDPSLDTPQAEGSFSAAPPPAPSPAPSPEPSVEPEPEITQGPNPDAPVDPDAPPTDPIWASGGSADPGT